MSSYFNFAESNSGASVQNEDQNYDGDDDHNNDSDEAYNNDGDEGKLCYWRNISMPNVTFLGALVFKGGYDAPTWNDKVHSKKVIPMT